MDILSDIYDKYFEDIPGNIPPLAVGLCISEPLLLFYVFPV